MSDRGRGRRESYLTRIECTLSVSAWTARPHPNASMPSSPATGLRPSARYRPLYPRWANSVVLLCLALFVATIAIAPLLLWKWVRTPYVSGAEDPVQQPVMFDHRHHLRDDGIDCRYCHYTVERSPYASVPPTELCMNCHNQIWNDSPMLATVRYAYFTDTPIRWERVHRLPDFVFFHHAVHVKRGIGCVSCHGRVDAMAQVEAASDLSMSWCLDCHSAPERHLRPLDQITNMEWKPDRSPLVVGAEIRRALDVRPPQNCTACHR